jgi:hypothetical protein
LVIYNIPGLSGVSTFYAEMMKGLGASSRLWELVDRQPAIPIQGTLISQQQIVHFCGSGSVQKDLDPAY